jgi:hypothetical protein
MESPANTSPRASRASSTSTVSSRRSQRSLTLDLSNLPPLSQPTPPSNTLLFTNLSDKQIFAADNLQTIRDLISQVAPIHTWSPLKSFARIVVSFLTEEEAIRVREVWNNEAILGHRVKVYFGQHTPVLPRDEHLALPDAGKLFFISPPPSPPHGWEMKLEDAPNKQVHAEDLAEALAKLHHHRDAHAALDTPISPDGASPRSFPTRSRSSTLIYQPDDHGSSPNLPAISVEDMTDEPMSYSPIDEPKTLKTHTARPPVELMHQA